MADQGGYSAAEFDAMPRPPCPVCGAEMDVQRIDVTANAEAELAHGRQYLAGLADCPHGCDQRTGERRHYQQQARRGPAIDGIELTCSCGADPVIAATRDEGEAWAAVHHPPGAPSFIGFG